jgi:hypothetical protein
VAQAAAASARAEAARARATAARAEATAARAEAVAARREAVAARNACTYLSSGHRRAVQARKVESKEPTEGSFALARSPRPKTRRLAANASARFSPEATKEPQAEEPPESTPPPAAFTSSSGIVVVPITR